MTRDAKKRLFDAVKACEAIVDFTNGKSREDYSSDLLLRSAVERQFEILGEALNQLLRLNPEVAARIPDVRAIIGMRNRLIHGYDAVSDAIVWDAVQNNVPELRRTLESMLENN